MSAIVASDKKRPDQQGLGNIADIIASVAGIGGQFTETKTKTKTSPQTRTSGLDISKEGVDGLIRQILESSEGLSNVSSGQRGAGLYNSTTNQLLTNDLTARTAENVAKASAKTIETTSGGTTTAIQPPKADLGTTLLTTAAGTLGKKLLDKTGILDTVGGAIDGGLDSVVDFFSGGGSGIAEAAGSTAANFFSAGGSGITGGISDSIGSVLGSSGDLIGDAFGGADFLGDFGGIGDAFGGLPVLSIGLDLLSGEPEDALASGAGFLIGNALLPGIGGPIGTILSDILPVGDVLGDIFGSVGDVFGSVVCTELHKQGLMSTELYHNDVAYAKLHMKEDTLDGYRWWGIPVVRWMRKSRFVTWCAAAIAIPRAHYIASIFGACSYSPKLARRGKVINAIGVPICNLIAKVTKPKDWSVLYSFNREVG